MHFATLLLQSQPDPEAIRRIAAIMLTIIPMLMLVSLVIVLVPFWFICKKAGFSPWLTLLNVLPLGTIVLWYVLAFAEWKVVPAPQVGWQQPPTYPPPSYPPQA
ncbi:MAG: hypothetical protein ABSC76_02640 [Terracidiphilus sp.]|jgi:ABC-type transport system involved in cytochrome c biogenesis permease subunit